MLALLCFLASALSGAMTGAVDDNDYVDQCVPALADRCFKGIMLSLECKLKMASAKSCAGIPEFCSVLKESLDCAADIIDTDCKADEGQINFDSWLKGLRSVYARLCDSKTDFIRDLSTIPCFNVEEFVDCVEELTKVTHVVDLLHVNLNTDECNRLLIALPTCNVRAHAAQSVCYMPQEIINDIIHTFFSHSPCAQPCPLHSNTSNLSSYVGFGLVMSFQALLAVVYNY